MFRQTYPDLQLDPLVVAEDRFDLEVDAYGADEGRGKGVIGVAEQEAGFAHAAVANNQELEHIIKVLISCVFLRGLLQQARVVHRRHLEDVTH